MEAQMIGWCTIHQDQKESCGGQHQFKVNADVEAGKFKCECKQWEHTGKQELRNNVILFIR